MRSAGQEISMTEPQQTFVVQIPPAASWAKCGGCHKTAPGIPPLWRWFNFKNLASTWLCPGCQPAWADQMEKLQEKGA